MQQTQELAAALDVKIGGMLKQFIDQHNAALAKSDARLDEHEQMLNEHEQRIAHLEVTKLDIPQQPPPQNPKPKPKPKPKVPAGPPSFVTREEAKRAEQERLRAAEARRPRPRTVRPDHPRLVNGRFVNPNEEQ